MTLYKPLASCFDSAGFLLYLGLRNEIKSKFNHYDLYSALHVLKGDNSSISYAQ
jgi:hypothetical protein